VPIFDAYAMVDWSAAAKPVIGANSIWIAWVRRNGGRLQPAIPVNLPTREAAMAEIRACLERAFGRGERVLLGFDFAFGYPSGLARGLGLSDPSWRGLWELIGELLIDKANNENNRFEVGAELNRRYSGGVYPFWGCPPRAESANLGRRKPNPPCHGALPDLRPTDRGAPGAQPVWKLAYPGSVGGQTLTGLARLWRLRQDRSLGEAVSIWPLETGFAPPPPGRRPLALLAEIYPSLWKPRTEPGEVLDAAQVRFVARHLAKLDASESLAPLLAAPAGLLPAARAAAIAEEAWILGARAPWRLSACGTCRG
jgi:hypothetical protein